MQHRVGSTSTSTNFFAPSGWHYILGEAILIILFTYFYTAVTFNPVDQADNLKKYGGFIPGVQTRAADGRVPRPDPRAPDLPRGAVPGRGRRAAGDRLRPDQRANFNFGGTSILIVIGVALDTMKQLEAQLMMRNYEGFLK